MEEWGYLLGGQELSAPTMGTCAGDNTELGWGPNTGSRRWRGWAGRNITRCGIEDLAAYNPVSFPHTHTKEKLGSGQKVQLSQIFSSIQDHGRSDDCPPGIWSKTYYASAQVGGHESISKSTGRHLGFEHYLGGSNCHIHGSCSAPQSAFLSRLSTTCQPIAGAVRGNLM